LKTILSGQVKSESLALYPATFSKIKKSHTTLAPQHLKKRFFSGELLNAIFAIALLFYKKLSKIVRFKRICSDIIIYY